MPDDMINEDFYIAPDTEMFILRGVPLDNTYEHTITWENLDLERSKQRDYFISKAKMRVLKQSYQRVDREWFKVYRSADELYDCNYIMFRNTAFNPNKWWYAFLLEVEYINNNTAKIRYEIDVMQTWLPGLRMDYQMLPCFVERCHAMSDELYENLIPESIVNSDEYLVDEIVEFDMNRMCVVVLATEKYVGGSYGVGGSTYLFKPANGAVKYGTYGSVFVTIWDITNENGSVNENELNELKNFLSVYVNAGKENSVISMQMFPRALLKTPSLHYGWENIVNGTEPMSANNSFTLNLTKPQKGQLLGGAVNKHEPKNMKLYSYPYNIIRINNECGNTMTYKWELFDKNERGKFTVTGTESWSPCAVIYPNKYKNISKNMEDSLTFNNFAICPWANDAFLAWWAQNSMNIGATTAGGIASLIAAVIGAGVGTATANPMLVATGIGGVVSAATKVATSLHQGTRQSSQLHGSTDTSLVLPAIKNVKFVLTKESLRPEILQIYDDYFTRFGYAQKKIMFPNLVARERWTYVQTVGFEFNGEINDTDTKKIKSIFDNGITFWRNPNDVGHYEYDNKPLV